MSRDPGESNDPLDFETVDRDIRINELSEQAKDMGLGELHVEDTCPPEIHEQFLKNVIDYESAPLSTPFARLEDAGVALPPPESLDDAALHAKLWEIVSALSKMSTFLSRTDHLSDRQLYERLWHDLLREASPVFPPGSGWVNHIDAIGSGSDEDIQISLRYYDDEEYRRHWAKDFPKDIIPPHEDPPYDRDRLLPKAPDHRP